MQQQRFDGFVHIAGDQVVVAMSEAKLLELADAIPQRIRLGCILGGQSWPAGSEVLDGQAAPAVGEVGVKLDRAFLKRDRFHHPAADGQCHGLGMELEGFQIRGRRIFQHSLELLYRA